MKKAIWSISKIVLSVATFPLWFVKLFVGVGHLPDHETGESVEVVFRHSIYENLCDGGAPFLVGLVHIAMATAISAIAVNAVNLKANSMKLQCVGNIVFGVAIGSFAILLLYASTVARGY